jgi:hypothetical protein
VASSVEKKKLTVENVMELLAGGVAIERITALVKERGIDFQITPKLRQEFIDSGADEDLVRALQSQQAATGTTPGATATQPAVTTQPPAQPSIGTAPPAGPSTTPSAGTPQTGLQIRSTPGNVSVFVDGEPKGTTTADEGLLQVAPLKPGKHHVRATHEGYQDAEGTVEVAAGQMLDTPLWLTKAQAAAAAEPSAPSLPAGTKFLVRHRHVDGGYCQGWLIVNVGYVRYISTDSSHKYQMGTSEMREAKPESRSGEFHIKLDFGRKYEFTAVDAKGNPVSPRAILADINYSMGK